MAGEFKRTFRLERSSSGDIRREIDDELAHHLELCAEELIDQGWAPEEASREAARRFGDMEETRAYCAQMQVRRGEVERRTAAASKRRLMLSLPYLPRVGSSVARAASSSGSAEWAASPI